MQNLYHPDPKDRQRIKRNLGLCVWAHCNTFLCIEDCDPFLCRDSLNRACETIQVTQYQHQNHHVDKDSDGRNLLGDEPELD